MASVTVQEAVEFVAQELGHTPTAAEYARHRLPDDPPLGMVRQFLQGQLSGDASVEIPDATPKEKPPALDDMEDSEGTEEVEKDGAEETSDKIREAVNFVARRLDRLPSREEYDRLRRPGDPCAETVYRHLGGWVRPYRTPERFSEAELLGVLRRFFTETRKTSTTAYKQWQRPPFPTQMTIVRRLGDWHSALRKAGLTPQSSEDDRFTDQELLLIVRKCAADTGGPPSISKYAVWRRSNPLAPPDYTIRTRLGSSWSVILRLAGVQTQGVPRPRRTDDELRAAVAEVATRIGHPPTVFEYDRERAPGSPKAETIVSRLGGWVESLAPGSPAPTVVQGTLSDSLFA